MCSRVINLHLRGSANEGIGETPVSRARRRAGQKYCTQLRERGMPSACAGIPLSADVGPRCCEVAHTPILLTIKLLSGDSFHGNAERRAERSRYGMRTGFVNPSCPTGPTPTFCLKRLCGFRRRFVRGAGRNMAESAVSLWLSKARSVDKAQPKCKTQPSCPTEMTRPAHNGAGLHPLPRAIEGSARLPITPLSHASAHTDGRSALRPSRTPRRGASAPWSRTAGRPGSSHPSRAWRSRRGLRNTFRTSGICTRTKALADSSGPGQIPGLLLHPGGIPRRNSAGHFVANPAVRGMVPMHFRARRRGPLGFPPVQQCAIFFGLLPTFPSGMEERREEPGWISQSATSGWG